MSVHQTTRNGQRRYVVKWRENGRQRSKSFDRRGDADEYDAKIRLLRAQGDLAHELSRRRATVSQFVAQWIDVRSPEVEESTATDYVRHFDQRVLPRLGNRRVTSLTPGDINAWIACMRANGDNDPTILKACTALQSALALAIDDNTITANPVAHAKKPPQGRRSRTPHLVKPLAVELMRLHMLEQGRESDVVLLELLAYAGLRPESEALPLTWKHARDRSLLIVDRKRGKERSVPTVDQLRESLNAWRLRSGRPSPDRLVVPPRPGKSWSASRDEWRYWRRHVFRPAALAAGLPRDVRPRDLRCSFVSLLVHEGRNIVEVARQCGHSPEVCLRDYAQVFDEHDPNDRQTAVQIIAAARTEARRLFHHSSTNTQENTRDAVA